MNSFALLQDDVEDDGAPGTPDPSDSAEPGAPHVTFAATDSTTPVKRDVSVLTDKKAPSDPADSPKSAEANGDKDPTDEPNKESDTPKERDISLEEYMAQKAAMASAIGSLNIRGGRQANDGEDGFSKMSVLKKKEDGKEAMTGVAVKEFHESKGLKDSTHAAVARNAEIQKFFQKDPNERRPVIRGRGRGDFRGRGRGGVDRGRGDRGRGADRGDRGGRGGDRVDRGGRGAPYIDRGRGRGRGYRDNAPFRGSHDNQHFAPTPNVVIAPNVDDTSAFPSL